MWKDHKRQIVWFSVIAAVVTSTAVQFFHDRNAATRRFKRHEFHWEELFGGRTRSLQDYLCERMVALHGVLEAYGQIDGKYPDLVAFDEYCALILTFCRQHGVTVTRTITRDTYEIILSPSQPDNEVLGGYSDESATVYLVEPRGIFEAVIHDRAVLPITSSKEVSWAKIVGK